MPSKAELRQKWNDAGKDKVVLHQFDRAKTRPNASPFCLKFETFLKVAGIEYEVDTTQPFGGKGKAPWMTFNGEDMSDSQFCIEHLMDKIESANIDKNLSDEQKAMSTALCAMIEEHFCWTLTTWHMVFNQGKFIKTILPPFPVPKFLEGLVFKQFLKQAANSSRIQGMGRHTKADVEKLAIRDLKAVSTLLGNKPFIFGDSPAVVDCCFFAFCSWVLCQDPSDDSPMKKELEKEDGDLKNLKDHFERMKEKYWSDWEEKLYKQEEKPKKEKKEKKEDKDEKDGGEDKKEDEDKDKEDKKDEEKKDE